MPMNFSEKDFSVLDALDRKEISSQRQLAEHAGISLGRVNYVLRSLLEKGLVKIGNFRKNPHKIGYAYLLTPKGIETKSRLASRFIVRRLHEYHDLKERLTERLLAIETQGHYRLVFIGPLVVKDFIDSILNEEEIKLNIKGHIQSWHGLKDCRSDSFDRAILFDGNLKNARSFAETLGIEKQRIISIW